MENPYLPYPVRIEKIVTETEDACLKTFTLVFLNVGGLGGTVHEDDPDASARVARMIARLLHATVREMDIATQCSLDRFELMLPRTSRTDAMIVAERLQQGFVQQAAREKGARQTQFTLSIGLAEVMEGDDLVRLYERTETALTAGTQSSPSGICFHNGRWAEAMTESPQVVH